MEKDNKRIVINLSNGFRLVAEQSQVPEFRNEIYVGIETDNAYSINENLRVVWNPDMLEVLNKFSVGIREDT